jgi:hypothetical protein
MAESAGNASEAMPAPSGFAEPLPGSLSRELGLRQFVSASCARCLARAGDVSTVWSAYGTTYHLKGGPSWKKSWSAL